MSYNSNAMYIQKAHTPTLFELVNDTTIFFLKKQWEDILKELNQLDEVTVITHNKGAYHVIRGKYDHVEIFQHGIGQALNEHIDMRFFLHHWAYGIVQVKKDISLYFFDKEGNQIPTIVIANPTDAALSLTKKYKDETQSTLTLEAYPIKEDLADEYVDLVAFHYDWQNLQDTHDFFIMLSKHKLNRLQALRLADSTYVKNITIENLIILLEKAQQEQMRFMSFVGNKGCIQIYTNKIDNLELVDQTIILSDERFMMSIERNEIKHIYIVRKPTTDGIVSAVELFNAKGEIIAQFFGERKRNTPELKIWSEILTSFF